MLKMAVTLNFLNFSSIAAPNFKMGVSISFMSVQVLVQIFRLAY